MHFTTLELLLSCYAAVLTVWCILYWSGQARPRKAAAYQRRIDALFTHRKHQTEMEKINSTVPEPWVDFDEMYVRAALIEYVEHHLGGMGCKPLAVTTRLKGLCTAASIRYRIKYLDQGVERQFDLMLDRMSAQTWAQKFMLRECSHPNNGTDRDVQKAVKLLGVQYTPQEQDFLLFESRSKNDIRVALLTYLKQEHKALVQEYVSFDIIHMYFRKHEGIRIAFILAGQMEPDRYVEASVNSKGLSHWLTQK